jgi:hypothetical protein
VGAALLVGEAQVPPAFRLLAFFRQDFQLHAVDGEILRVENAGFGQWVILAS